MKPYVFNGIEYNDLNSLALAFKDNFDQGIVDIYTNPKKLVKFLKERTNNKDRVKNLVDILALSKYKNNALTFVIFDFLDIKEVVLDGKSVSFTEFLDMLKRNPTVENNVLFAFMEDHGITRCYERMDPTNKKFKDMYFVERYFDNPFTYKYLTTLYEFEVIEQNESKVNSIIIENEECFRRATKLMKLESFQLWIAHKYGFKEAIKIVSEKNPVFYTLKLLKSEIADDELRKILQDSFFWWLYDNFEKYDYSGKAVLTQKKLIDIKKMYTEYMVRMEKKEINKVSFDNYCDISRSLFLAYLDFVYYLKDGSILVNRRFDAKKFALDKPYCFTYISEDYMKGKVIKLYNGQENDNAGETNENGEAKEVIDDKNINDEYNEKPIEVGPGNDDEIFFREKKNIDRDARFSTYSAFLGFVALALFSIGIALAVIKYDSKLIDVSVCFSALNIALGIGSGFLALALGIYLSFVETKREEALADYKFFLNANTKDYITLVQEERYYKVKTNLDNIRGKILNRKKWVTALLGALASLSLSVVSIVLACMVLNLMEEGKFNAAYSKVYVKLLIIFVPLLLGFLVGLLRKKKAILVTLLTIAIIGLTFVWLLFL